MDSMAGLSAAIVLKLRPFQADKGKAPFMTSYLMSNQPLKLTFCKISGGLSPQNSHLGPHPVFFSFQAVWMSDLNVDFRVVGIADRQHGLTRHGLNGWAERCHCCEIVVRLNRLGHSNF